MAQRRMISPSVIDTDEFMDMPMSSQSLYFHMLLKADDDGFLANPKRIIRFVGAADDDFRVLLAKQYVLPFESGICVIRHWRVHNLIRADRYHPTIYKEEKEALSIESTGVYTLATKWHPNGTQMVPKVRLGKVRLGKEDIICKVESVPYTEIIEYLNEVCKTRYKVTENHRSHINARWNEGMRLEDFKTVIDKKYTQWGSDEQMSKYLRPQTLFGTKMDGYVNEIIAGKKEPVGLKNWKQKRGIE